MIVPNENDVGYHEPSTVDKNTFHFKLTRPIKSQPIPVKKWKPAFVPVKPKVNRGKKTSHSDRYYQEIKSVELWNKRAKASMDAILKKHCPKKMF